MGNTEMKHNHDKVEKDAFIVIQPVICYNKKYKIGGEVKMTYNAFLFPEAILDTPRLFTAVAEWLAVFVYFNICRRRVDQKRYIVYCILSATSMILFQFNECIFVLGAGCDAQRLRSDNGSCVCSG